MILCMCWLLISYNLLTVNFSQKVCPVELDGGTEGYVGLHPKNAVLT